jgi:hypothetical protein
MQQVEKIPVCLHVQPKHLLSMLKMPQTYVLHPVYKPMEHIETHQVQDVSKYVLSIRASLLTTVPIDNVPINVL